MSDPVLPASRIGGKGHNLAVLSKKGVRVPPWIVLTTHAFETLLADQLAEIDRIAVGCGGGTSPAVAAGQIRKMIEGVSFDPGIRNGILGALEEMLGDRRDAWVAVRSSAVDEDSSEHSFAGQLDSYLFQKLDDGLFLSIKRCMASAFNERALAYRLANGLSMRTIRAAVVIQEMVFGDVSGVAFTANPINGNPEQCLVNAVYGIGEGIVSGELDCDSWVFDPEGAILREDIHDKSEMIVFDRKTGVGTTKVQVEESRCRERCLDKEALASVFASCRKIESEIYGGQPQDIEWCVKGKELFILQSRPIAAFAGLRKAGKYIVFDNSNVVESYAGVPTPLTYSFASASFRETFKGVFVRLGMSKRRLREINPIFINMLGYVHGRMYYNLLNWYRYFQEIPLGGDNIREFDQLIGIAPENAVAKPADSWQPGLRRSLSRFYLGLRMAHKIRRIKWVAEDFERHFFRGNGKYVNEFFRTQSNPELIEIYREVFENGSPYWDGEIVNFIGAQRWFAELARLLTALGFTSVASIENDLIGGDGEIASMRPTREMMAIADLIRADEALKARFLANKPDELSKAVLEGNEAVFEPIRKRIEKFLEEYGCRCMNELKLEEPTLREDPEFLFATLRSYVAKKPMPFEKQLENQLAARRKAEKLVYGRAGFWGGIRLRLAIRKVRRHVYYREELRLVRGKYWGIVRRIFRAIGCNFQAQGVLQDWNDIFLLKVDEIAELVEGRSPDLGHVGELIELRKRARAENMKRPAPSRIYSYGDVCALNFTYRAGQTGSKGADFAGSSGVMKGIACGPGIAKGRAKVVLSGAGAAGLDGEILVTERTDPGWIPLYPSISGLVIERGSVLSHSAVVAREMGIPTVVGVVGATQRIRSDDLILVDGAAGTVQLLSKEQAEERQVSEEVGETS